MTFKKGHSWNSGIPLTEDHKRHISEALREHYKTHISPNKGRRMSEEQRHKISLTYTGHKPTLEDREKMSQAVKEWWNRPGVRERMSLAHKRYWKRIKRRNNKKKRPNNS